MRRKNKNINRGALKRTARGTTMSLPHIELHAKVRVKGQAPLFPGAYVWPIAELREHGMTVYRCMHVVTRNVFRVPLEHLEPM
jgi:hypothetical protein